MGEIEAVDAVRRGTKAWSEWRSRNVNRIIRINDQWIKGLDLRGINFLGCIFEKVIFEDCDLRDSNFQCCSLEKVSIRKSKLKGANLQELKADQFILQHVKGEMLNIDASEINEFVISDSVLANASFKGIEIKELRIFNSNLNETKFSHARIDSINLEQVSFVKASLDLAVLKSGYGVTVDFSGAALNNSHIVDGSFLWGIFKGANLKYCNLQGTRLPYADVRDADLKWCNLENSMLEKIKFTRRTKQKKYQGVRISTAHGNDTFKRYAQDQSYVEELRDSGIKGWLVFWVWWASANCGRSFWPWAGWSLLFALSFAALFFFILGPESFKFAGPPADSFQTMIYYSVVTFTTLGFGDVTPVTKGAMWAVMAEVVLGYIMLGGLISILANKLARRS